MELALRRAFLGYRKAATIALFKSLEQDALAAQQARDAEFGELSRQMDGALAALRETEARIAAEQERQQVALAIMDELACRGAQAVAAAQAGMAAVEAAAVGRIARREMVLAQRRQLMHGLHDDVEAAIRRAMRVIEPTAAGGEPAGRDQPDLPGPPLAGGGPQEWERAGA